MHEAYSAKQAEIDQTRDASIQKPARAQEPLQRAIDLSRLAFYDQLLGHRPPTGIRLSPKIPASTGQPVQRRVEKAIQQVQQPLLEPTELLQRKENTTGLPDTLKAGIEDLSGLSLDDVRVHYSSSKPAQVQALAYTQGTEIHVGPGQEQHLAHETWHVVQQKQGRVQSTLQMKGVSINNDVALEREADVMGGKVSGEVRSTQRSTYSSSSVKGALPTIISHHSTPQGSIQRQEAASSESAQDAPAQLLQLATFFQQNRENLLENAQSADTAYRVSEEQLNLVIQQLQAIAENDEASESAALVNQLEESLSEQNLSQRSGTQNEPVQRMAQPGSIAGAEVMQRVSFIEEIIYGTLALAAIAFLFLLVRSRQGATNQITNTNQTESNQSGPKKKTSKKTNTSNEKPKKNPPPKRFYPSSEGKPKGVGIKRDEPKAAEINKDKQKVASSKKDESETPYINLNKQEVPDDTEETQEIVHSKEDKPKVAETMQKTEVVRRKLKELIMEVNERLGTWERIRSILASSGDDISKVKPDKGLKLAIIHSYIKDLKDRRTSLEKKLQALPTNPKIETPFTKIEPLPPVLNDVNRIATDKQLQQIAEQPITPSKVVKSKKSNDTPFSAIIPVKLTKADIDAFLRKPAAPLLQITFAKLEEQIGKYIGSAPQGVHTSKEQNLPVPDPTVTNLIELSIGFKQLDLEGGRAVVDVFTGKIYVSAHYGQNIVSAIADLTNKEKNKGLGLNEVLDLDEKEVLKVHYLLFLKKSVNDFILVTDIPQEAFVKMASIACTSYLRSKVTTDPFNFPKNDTLIHTWCKENQDALLLILKENYLLGTNVEKLWMNYANS